MPERYSQSETLVYNRGYADGFKAACVAKMSTHTPQAAELARAGQWIADAVAQAVQTRDLYWLTEIETARKIERLTGEQAVQEVERERSAWVALRWYELPAGAVSIAVDPDPPGTTTTEAIIAACILSGIEPTTPRPDLTALRTRSAEPTGEKRGL